MGENSPQYTVLARRFRPQTFGEVVGQQHVAQALQNAIQTSRVAHAYLFTGVRGVGKTSMARILAKSLNCPETKEGVPCNQCDICQSISAGVDMDVQEIDGASNRGIDDIRSLRANVNVRSMRSTYKIYIIDEVHALTKDAFNALLKTLEEPPPNVKFIFCTTEANKVPDTILSRCQRFDFSTIDIASIVERLHHIAKAEGADVEPAALELIARRASGSMRDSQSLFDQLLAFGREHIVASDVHRLLGTAADERLMTFADALIEGHSGQALQQLDAAVADGVQLSELVDQLLSYLRDLMVLSSGAEDVGLLSVSIENRDALARQAEQWGLHKILAGMQILVETKTRMFRASYARALAEMAVVRIALLDSLDDLNSLIGELKSGSGNSSPAPARQSQQPNHASRRPAPADKTSPTPTPLLPEKKNSNCEIRADAGGVEAQKTVPHVELQNGTEQAVWTQVLSHADDGLREQIRAATSVAISGPNQLAITFPKSYHFNKQYCERPEVLGRLERVVSQVAGRSIRVSLRIEAAEVKPADSSNAQQPAQAPIDSAANTNDDLFVEQAKEVFEAKVIKVEGISSPPTREE